MTQPAFPTLNDQGIALARAGRLDEALAVLQQAIRLRPDHAGAYNNLGNVLRRLGRFAEAEQAMLQAVQLDPAEADFLLNLGHLLRQQGRLPEAERRFRQACNGQPGRADACKALGSVLFDLGRATEACDAFRQALALAPGDAENHNDLGNSLRQLERHAEAAAGYQEALRLRPDLTAAHANLANLRAEEGRTEEARQGYARAYHFQPQPRLRALSELALPVIYDSMDHLHESRQRLLDNLRRLEEEGVRLDPTRELMPTLFYLAYQGENDRDIHAAMARLGARPLRSSAVKKLTAEDAEERGEKIRIGFLSAYLRNHTIGRLNQGLIARLARDTFEVTVLAVGPPGEGLGRRIQESADRFLVLPPQLPAALQTVAALGLDILYFPDIGMDPQTYTMAYSRLAPVQCVTWGHPVTTGLPAIDYFLSSQDLETESADGHYTEKLVRLSRLGVYYERPELPAPPKDRTAFGLPAAAHLYVCPQTLFKFHPEFDALLGGILRADPAGLLVLIEGKYPHWTELLRRRFGRTLADVQDRIRFLPHQGRDDFLRLLAVADVLLDPIHFGGGNTSYEGLAVGTPIVTLPSAFLRGRLTYAMYRQMGLDDLVAADPEEYVRLAVRLGTDNEYGVHMRERIRAASGVLFEDDEAVRELERFLLLCAPLRPLR